MSIRPNEIKDRFRGKKIAVIGDVVADQFLNGTISRVSREAPVFILKHNETETRPGAAANAAANVAALGGMPILVGSIGDDPNGDALQAALRDCGVSTDRIVTRATGKTTTKVRVLAGQTYAARKQVIRIDYEDDAETSSDLREKIANAAAEAIKNADAVVLSDYNYGVATDELIAEVRKLANDRGIPCLADSRFGLRRFAGFTSATPNQEEAEALLGRSFRNENAESIRADLDLASLLVTLGGDGMVLAERNKPFIAIPAVGSLQPVDVTGAGDTVIAAFALGLASGMNAADSAAIANHAGGIVVMKRGTAVVSIDELETSFASINESEASAAANES
jgi:rfaE bifunctional protein kinase chain/domain